MRYIYMCVMTVLTVAGAFAQNCEPFAATLDQLQRDAIAESKQAVDTDEFYYTVDRKKVAEHTLRTMCKDDLQLDRVTYRAIEGSQRVQAWIALTRVTTTTTQGPTYLLRWEVTDATPGLAKALEHPAFHMQRQNEAGKRELLFELPEASIKTDVTPERIEEISVWKQAQDLRRYGVPKAHGLIVMELKQDADYRNLLDL